MNNQRTIKNEELIKEIEEEGEFLCKGDELCVWAPKEKFYYYYKDRVYSIVRTRAYTVEEQDSMVENLLIGLQNAAMESGLGISEEEVRKDFEIINKQPIESVVIECVEEDLNSINSDVLYSVVKHGFLR